MTRIDTSHHARSLELLAIVDDPSVRGSLAEALAWLLPVRVSPAVGSSESRLVSASARFADVGHWRSDREYSWVRTLWIDLSVEQGSQVVAASARVDLPWTCDAATQEASEDLGAGFAVGAHDGLYVGRPLVPLAHNARRPGVWIEHRTTGPQRVVVPEIGPAVRFGWLGPRPAAAVNNKQLVDLRGTSSESTALVRFLDCHVLSPRGGSLIVSDALDAVLCEVLQGIETFLDPDPARFERLAPRVGHEDEAVAETAPDRREFRLYGDILRREIVESVRRGIDEWVRVDHPASRIGDLVGLALQSRIDELVRVNRPGGLLRTDDDRSTLSRLELRRTVTQIGPRGTPNLRAGRPWLRGLHPEFRGILCPLLGPENEKLGLVRGLALSAQVDSDGAVRAADDVGRLGELSASASLVPFLNHDDPTRAFMGAKNLRQAVPLMQLEPPLIRTGSERWIGEHGVVRSPIDGRVVDVQIDAILIEGDDGRRRRIGVGAGRPSATAVAAPWESVVGVGDDVDAHDIIAVAPDVLVEDGAPVLALGANVLTALAVWRGWNFEDGIVVSRSLSKRFASSHVVAWRERLAGHGAAERERPETFELSIDLGSSGTAGSVIGWVYRWDEPVREVVFPEDGVLTECYADHGEVCFEIEVRRPLEVGDKLTTRHGGKGVVSIIEADEDMPTLPDGARVDMILNPLSIARRVAVGQYLEIHQGLRQYLTSEGAIVVGRQHGSVVDLFDDLAAHGAPGGRLPLTVRGRPFGPDDGVVVGPLYVVKLDHLARPKARARRSGAYSPVDNQPSKQVSWLSGRRTGAAQRVGEMEMWALAATDATVLIDDTHARSDQGDGTLASVRAHLLVAGIHLADERTGTGWRRSLMIGRLPDLVDFDVDSLDGDRNSLSWTHPLHDHRHGRMEPVARCTCGASSDRGTVCSSCGTVARTAPSADRAEFRFAVRLVAPVRHPWGLDVEIGSVPILPPAFRRRTHDPLDRAYERLIRVNARLRDEAAPSEDDIALLSRQVAAVLGSIDDPVSAGTIAGRLNGKRGLLRRALRGRNTDLSARLVLSPDPTLGFDEIALPSDVLERLQIPADASPDTDRVVILNRPPTLRPSAFVALVARLGEGHTARINPYLCGLIAGDFDGDEGTVHRPMDPASREAALERLGLHAAFRSAANGDLLGSFDHELAVGLLRRGRGLEIARTASPEVLQRLRELQADAFEASTGCSLGLADFLDESAAMLEALAAGAIGSARTVEQIRRARGAAGVDFYGLETPAITTSFASGLSDEEYALTTPASLRKLSDKKLVTPLAGGVTKMITEMAYDVLVGADECDRVGDHPLALLTCELSDGSICRRCYGALPNTGLPPEVGAHVGVLAASMIGERTTQAAMKAHGGGGKESVADRVRPLAALFGRSALTPADGVATRTSIVSLLGDPDANRDVLEAIRDRFSRELDVDGRHIEVIWRRLARCGSVESAERTGDPLIDASARGRLDILVGGAAAGWRADVPRTGRAQVVGGAR